MKFSGKSLGDIFQFPQNIHLHLRPDHPIWRSPLIGILIVTAMIVLLLVLFRMKSIEQDYELNDLKVKRDKLTYEYKELRAEMARLRSIKNLKAWAKEFDLYRPTQEQILIIP